MPLDHSSATATISVTGLALGCYNLNTSNFEVGFIRHPGHVLNITVGLDTETESTRAAFQLDSNHRIFIETEGGITPPQPPFFKPTANFDRKLSGQDPEDFQWIVDLEKELNGGQEVTLKRPEFPVTQAFISKPYLYADEVGFALGNMNRINVDNPAEVELFGRLCEVIKGDITCEDGGAVVLRVEGPFGFSIRMPRLPGLTYGISMDNTCPSPLGSAGMPGDFAIYYSVVESTGGKKFFFRRVITDLLNPDSTCNGSFLGERDQLFPLPN